MSSGQNQDVDQALKASFAKNPFPSMQELIDLEAETGMTTKKIIYWFQQTRKTQRKHEKLQEDLKQAFITDRSSRDVTSEKGKTELTKACKALKKSSSWQSLYSHSRGDSDSSGDFRGFESDGNQAGRSFALY